MIKQKKLQRDFITKKNYRKKILGAPHLISLWKPKKSQFLA